ncbi:hypothetical protein BKA70DRAFT_1331248, partial [Coprinopsis sp. MPI-PUGE-AT-0042]
MADFNKLLRTARTVVFGIVCVLSLADFAIACIIFLSQIVGFPHSLYLTTCASGFGNRPPLLTYATCNALALRFSQGRLHFLCCNWRSHGAGSSGLCGLQLLVRLLGSTVDAHVLHAEAPGLRGICFHQLVGPIFYTTTLFVVAIMSHNKGNSVVWTSSVRTLTSNAAVQQSSIPAVTPGPQAQQPDNPPQQPMQQQQPLAPQGSYFPQANYTPHNAGSGFTGPPQAVYQQPVAI